MGQHQLNTHGRKTTPDISELVEKAKIVAEATGRDEQEVLADLLDDGIVNLSNEESKGKGFSHAIERKRLNLITTVQAINKDVSENSCFERRREQNRSSNRNHA